MNSNDERIWGEVKDQFKRWRAAPSGDSSMKEAIYLRHLVGQHGMLIARAMCEDDNPPILERVPDWDAGLDERRFSLWLFHEYLTTFMSFHGADAHSPWLPGVEDHLRENLPEDSMLLEHILWRDEIKSRRAMESED